MKHNWLLAYMDAAERFAQESNAVRLKVGALIVKDNRILSVGINGMPSGWPNECEEKIYLNELANPFMNDAERDAEYPYQDEYGYYKLVTKEETLHSESNALSKALHDGQSTRGATFFVTHSPCIHCAKMIYQSGVKALYYRHAYRCNKGLEFLEKCGIEIHQI